MNYSFQKHISNLNALRAISALYVFITHYYNYIGFQKVSTHPIMKWIYTHLLSKGDLGVNFFFVLSGFLITYLLLKEEQEAGKVTVWKFYVRRILRIWPLYFSILLFGYVLQPIISNEFSMDIVREHIWYHVGFVSNFDRIISNFVGMGCDELAVLWSVGVEEQFYLVWPVLFLFVPRKYLTVVLLALIAYSFFFRYHHIYDSMIVSYHTFCVMNDLLVGCFFALVFVRSFTFRNFIVDMSPAMIISGYLLFAGYLVFNKDLNGSIPVMAYLERIIFSLFFIFIILEQSFAEKSIFKLGKFKMLEAIGKISYGFYALHLICIMALQYIFIRIGIKFSPEALPFYIGLIFTFSLSVLISQLSYRCLETPFLALRSKYNGIKY